MDNGQNNQQNPQGTTPASTEPQAPITPQPIQDPQPPVNPGAAVPTVPSPTPDAASTPLPATQPAMSETPAAPPPQAPAPVIQQEPTPVVPAQAATPQSQPPVLMPATDTMQQTVTIPQPGMPSASQPPAGKKGISIWLVMSFIVLLLAGIGGYYFYLLDKGQPNQQAARIAYPTKTVSPTVAATLSPSPVSSGSAVKQGVSGTVCYPGSVIPAGIITAKDITTNKLYTQAYAGSTSSGTTYSFALPVGVYHLKFTTTKTPEMNGYYTTYSTCVENPTNPSCSGTKVRPSLDATVSANMAVQNVNLCDYYYPTNTPPQF